MYRQISGGNYQVSVTQILGSEKKLRIKSMLGLKSARYGVLPFYPELLINEEIEYTEEISKYDPFDIIS